jgi:exodeoxyribonuclease X
MPTIRVIDFETTGMEPPFEVCEVGYCDLLQTEGGWAVTEEPVSWLCGASEMPPEVRAIHHIRLEEVIGEEPFDAAGLWTDAKTAGVSVMAAHNLEFEAKFWGAPILPTLCTYKAALRVWPEAPSHSNGALRYWLEDQDEVRPIHATTMPPHRAGPDAYVTAWLLKALLRRVTAAQMVAWTKEPRLLPTCPLGKFRGKRWGEVETGFLTWMLGQPTMEADLKWNAEQELERRRHVI